MDNNNIDNVATVFQVQGQTISLYQNSSMPNPIAGSLNFITFGFRFNAEWENIPLVEIHFVQDDPKELLLGEGDGKKVTGIPIDLAWRDITTWGVEKKEGYGTVQLPYNLKPGQVQICVLGKRMNEEEKAEVIATTNAFTFTLQPNIHDVSEIVQPPETPIEQEAFLAMVQKAVDSSTSLYDKLNDITGTATIGLDVTLSDPKVEVGYQSNLMNNSGPKFNFDFKFPATYAIGKNVTHIVQDISPTEQKLPPQTSQYYKSEIYNDYNNRSFNEDGTVRSGNVSTGIASHAEGSGTSAMGNYSHAENHYTVAKGNSAHAEGFLTMAIGESSHAEGITTTASGMASHAEGENTTASGHYSHAEGITTTASGEYSHAEGENTTASGHYSHVEGITTTASGMASHAEGLGTIAVCDYSHVQGKYNIADDENKYAMIIGNGGDANNRSNALTVNWNGNIECGTINGIDVPVVKEALDTTIANVSNLETELGTTNTNVSNLETELGTTNTNVSNLETELGTTNTNVSSLETKLGVANIIMSNFETKLDTTKTNVSNLETELDTTIASVSNLETVCNSKTGKSMEGQIVQPTYGVNTPAGIGAEIFNDYADRTYFQADAKYFADAGNIATGAYSHAEGRVTTASGSHSHAEGVSTTASGECSHAEGENTTASGLHSHAEGENTTASGQRSHAEGDSTTASGHYSHAEGLQTIATGLASHAEGNRTKASGSYAHAEGARTYAGDFSHAEGSDTEARGILSHAEGHHTIASGWCSHVQGQYNVEDVNDTYAMIIGNGSENARSNALTVDWNGNIDCGLVNGINLESLLVERSGGVGFITEGQVLEVERGHYATAGTGAEIFNDCRTRQYDGDEHILYGNVATGNYSHAEGMQTTASDQCSHAEGVYTTASGQASHAEGGYTTASGEYSHAGGFYTIANAFQFATGKYNVERAGCINPEDQSSEQSLFIVGYGTSDSNRANAFRITADGVCKGVNSFMNQGADFAEYFEWADGNPDNEDRRGKFVTLDGKKIRLASSEDDYILGAVSGTGAFIGNSASENWQGMYLKDVFGKNLTQQVEIPEQVDEVTGETIPAHTVTQFVINPEYNPEQEYISREFRKEWSPVGFHGQIILVDDGTCQVNSYCKPSVNGIATASTSGYRVMNRLDSNHIEVLIK